jgi:replicative DNA helicase
MFGIKAVKEMLFKETPQQQQQQPPPAPPGVPLRGGPPPPSAAPSPATPASSSLPKGAPTTYSNGKSFVPKRIQPAAVAPAPNTENMNTAAASPAPAPAATTASTSARVSIRDALNQQKIFLPNYAPGSYRAKCPKCNGGSKGEASFSITVDDDSKSAVWQCFRSTCGFSGSTHIEKPSAMVNSSGFFVSTTNRKRKEEPPVRPKANLEPLTEEMIEFFKNRGISEATLKRNKVSSELVYDPMKKEESRVIAFPYFRDGDLINVKYRTLDKRFWQAKGAEKILYGLDDVASQAEIIIVEGEMDKLALEEAGFKNVVSVPDGAPARVKDGDLPPASEDTKYSYLWNCRAWLDQAVRVVIATDNDAPGDALAEELARRLGRERCWRVRWPLIRRDHEFAARSAQVVLPPEEEATLPVDGDGDGVENEGASISTSSPNLMLDGTDVQSLSGSESDSEATDLSSLSSASSSAPTSVDQRYYRKDANEVLLRDGDAILRAFVESAEPLPIRGLLRFHEYYDDVMKYYYLEHKDGQGVSTGWGSLDKYYKVIPGELTIVTGVPNSGKSEWIDALLSNLSEMHGWTFAMCSMEKRATDHARQLAEKYVGHPFFDLPYARGVRRMTLDELDSAMDWVDDRFHLIRYEDDQLPSVDWVLEIAKAAVYRYGIRGLVIDPYNELDHQRPASMNETEYVSQMLTKVKRFAQTAGVHVWFVAHPRQLREWKGQAPNLYDISGSAHFINKADNGIVVHRNRDPNAPSGHQVQILVRKVRNKAAGTMGDCILEYERINGRYLDPEGHSMVTPRTSQKVVWKDREPENNGAGSGGGGQEIWQNGSGAFVHRDGTINREPEGMF